MNTAQAVKIFHNKPIHQHWYVPVIGCNGMICGLCSCGAVISYVELVKRINHTSEAE